MHADGSPLDAFRLLYDLPPAVRQQLRRLLVSCHQNYMSVFDQIAEFPALCELSLDNFALCSISLHPANKGLTRLHLSRLSTSAAQLKGMIS
jgi:hypothetical protein